jgi:hypothetical protein
LNVTTPIDGGLGPAAWALFDPLPATTASRSKKVVDLLAAIWNGWYHDRGFISGVLAFLCARPAAEQLAALMN